MEKVYRLTKEEFKKVKTAWKKLSDMKAIKPEDIVVYNLLREKDPYSGFVEVINHRRIKGNDSFFAFRETRYKLFRYVEGIFRSNRAIEDERKKFEDTYGIPYPVYLDTQLINLY